MISHFQGGRRNHFPLARMWLWPSSTWPMPGLVRILAITDGETGRGLKLYLRNDFVRNLINGVVRSGYRNDSVVYLDFLFERQTGFFLLQIYTPLTLIVFCSWVSFWLVKTEAVRENIVDLRNKT